MVYNEMGWESEVLVNPGLTIFRSGKIRILRMTGVACNASGGIHTLVAKDIPAGVFYLLSLQVTSGGKVYPSLTSVNTNGVLASVYYVPTALTGSGSVYGTGMYTTYSS